MTAQSPVAPPTREEIEEAVRSVGFWWHSIDLGEGVVTPGMKPPALLAQESVALDRLDLGGRSVLDIGAYDGYFSFSAERRGASRVVALDHYVWSLDLPAHIAYWRDCMARGVVPLPNEETAHWQPDRMPGRRAFDTAHRVLRSRVEPVVGDFMSMELAPLGGFDVVLFLGVLYHLEDPMGALRRVASLTREVAVIETHAVAVPGHEDRELVEFYSANQLNGDVSNWWGPNRKALEGMCLAAGFRRVDFLQGEPGPPPGERTLRQRLGMVRRRLAGALGGRRPVEHFRALVLAWK